MSAPLTESELAEVAVALDCLRIALRFAEQPERILGLSALYAKIAALNEGADK